MNLIIDIGNSLIKAALTVDGEIVKTTTYEEISTDILDELISEGVDSAILSSTRNRDVQLVDYLRRRVQNFVIFDHKTPIPILNRYATPETLGMDRLAAAVGAWGENRGKELLIFDFGTAITVDKVTAEGEFVGGNISPGMRMRFTALNNFTDKLPLIKYEDVDRTIALLGDRTRDAIWNGVVRGIDFEIEGYISRNPESVVFFTGRDAKYFAKCSENAIFADDHLVFKGLERIIQYNKCKIKE